MNSFPLVSVIIPAYNADQYIVECIDSVFRQSYKHLEVIVVDDGSLDNTVEIIKRKYGKKIILISQKNAGACVARNVGFKKCNGQWIQFLDADDTLHPEKIFSQLEQLNNDQVDVIFTGKWDRFYANTYESVFPKRLLDKDWESPIDWLINSWEGRGMTAQHAWLTPRSLIEKAGMWDERLRVNQDGEFFNRVLLKAKGIKYCAEAKVYYRSGNTQSVSSKLGPKKVESLLLSYQLYVQNTLPIYDNKIVRHALMTNFLQFIYQYDGLYPELAKIARIEISALGFKKLPPYGGGTFKKMALFLGFENALRIRKLMKGY